MSEDSSRQAQAVFVTPVSSFTGPIGELIAQHMLSPPSRPGLLAVLDRFEILRILGGGGMGLVVLARDTAVGQEVAIKLIKSELLVNPEAAHRFVKEAGHRKRLRHPNVMPVLEVSDRPQGPYFVMPYFERGSLANQIQLGRPLDAETVLDDALQVAEGLQFAHRRGIIHRDLKPANILLGADGKVCLADFGLARTLFNDTIVDVEHQHWEGTAPYMSPAVAAGEAEDTRCDIYAFGAVPYEMLTGEPPYRGRITKEILAQILAGPPKPIATVNPRADRGLATVAEGALARELRERYADMKDVLADLQRIKEGKPPIGPHGAGRKLRDKLLRVAGISIRLRVAWVLACVTVITALAWFLWFPQHPKLAATVRESPGAATNKAPPPPAPVATNTLEEQTFQTPWGLAVDNAGNVYVTDKERCTICKVTPSGAMTILAGLAGNPGSTDGIGADARFAILRGIALDQAGNVYAADAHVIRRVTPSGEVTRYPAGITGFAGYARFDLPSGMAADSSGNVHVADRYVFKKITPAGDVTILAGREGHTGRADGTATNASFSDHEKGLAVDSAGNLYVGDTFNHAIRKITPDGKVVHLAGSSRFGSADGTATNAQFFKPCGLAVDSAGNVYVADSGNHTVRKITPAGQVSTLAGRAGQAGRGDGMGTNAFFNNPQGVAVDNAGNVYVADTGNQMLRRISAGGEVVSVAGQTNGLNSTRGAGTILASNPGVPAQTLPAGVNPYVNLTRAAVSEGVILAVIRKDTNVPYSLTDAQIIYLENQGVSENVILALLERK